MLHEIIYFLTSLIYLLGIFITELKNKIGKRYFAASTISIYTVFLILYIIGYLEFYFNKNINNYIFVVGLILTVTALLVEIISIKQLGKYFATHIEIKSRHKLITTGIFKYCRHPGYLSAILLSFGAPLLLSSYLTLLFSILVIIPLILIKIHYEEKILLQKFGKKYNKYQESVPMLIPLKLK